jgi:hypothetical protein
VLGLLLLARVLQLLQVDLAAQLKVCCLQNAAVARQVPSSG